MSAAPQPAVPPVYNSSALSGYGFGGDNGQGFHSTGPVNLPEYEETEFKREALQNEPTLPTETFQSYYKYPESPFTRYVTRPLSNGTLSDDVKEYEPENRSKMGTPLNPFWIRNDLWSIQNEASIFMDAGPNWVTPRLKVDADQTRPVKRDVYLSNEEQPQYGQGSTLSATLTAAPAAPACGVVKGTQAAEAAKQTLELTDANPAKMQEDTGDQMPQSIAPTPAKRTATEKEGTLAVEGENQATAPPKKKKGRPMTKT